MTGVLMSIIILLFYLAFYQRWMLVRERRAHRLELSQRPVGQILDVEETGNGILVTGRIFDERVSKAIRKGTMEHLSLGAFKTEGKP